MRTIGGLIISAVLFVGGTAYGQTPAQEQVCAGEKVGVGDLPATIQGIQVSLVDANTVLFDLPEGMNSALVCVKAGSAKQGDGPESISISQDTALDHSSGKDLSHVSVINTTTTEPGPSPSPSASPSPTPTFDTTPTPTPVPTVETTVGVQETRPPWESPVPDSLPSNEVRGEVVRGTDNSPQPVHNGRDQLPATGMAGVGTLLLIVLVVWSLGFLMIWLSERRGYRG